MKIHRWLLLPATLYFLAAVDCGPARDAHCSNDGECEALGGDFKYCLESRCVECVTSAACGAHRYCHQGACTDR
ncbi:MAG TPA: hypothetical protein VGI10_15810 [Polyangiaceae bacterium]